MILSALLAARTLVAWTPLVHFDIDPAAVSREAVVPFDGLGPASSLLLDGLTSACAALLLWLLRRDRAAGWLGMLTIAAAVVAALDVWFVLRGDFENLWRGSAWVSAFLGAGALAACASGPSRAKLQRLALGTMGVVVGAWILRGALQLLVEHPAMVEQFLATRDEFLSAQGWTPDSVQALTYERRVTQREAAGWFGLSNIMSGVCAAAGTACALVWWRSRRCASALLAMRGGASSSIVMNGTCVRRCASALARPSVAIAAVSCAAIVAVNGSKGASASAVIGCVAGLIVSPRASVACARAVLIASIALPALAILTRGAVGDRLGELSLLFRSHYWDGAARVIASMWPWGTGPDGFQAAYTLLRGPLAVEEVTSAHAAPIDWVACLGVAGVGLTLAWIALVIAPARAADDDLPMSAAADAGDADWKLLLPGVAVIAAVATMADPDDRALTLIGVLLGAATALAWMRSWAAMSAGAQRSIAVGVVAALSTHAMVEMTLWQPGSASWVLGVVAAFAMTRGGGCVAGNRCTNANTNASTNASTNRNTSAAAAGSTFAGCATQPSAARPPCASSDGYAWAHCTTLGLVIAMLMISAVQCWSAHHVNAQEAQVEAAADALVEGAFTAAARVSAAEGLMEAYASHADLRRRVLLLRASDQWLQAAMLETDPARARVWFGEALASATLASVDPPLRAVLMRAGIVDAMESRGLADADAVLVARRDVLALDPRHTASLARRAFALAALGRMEEARDAASAALEADDSFVLDPLRQLPTDDRAALERLRDHGGTTRHERGTPVRGRPTSDLAADLRQEFDGGRIARSPARYIRWRIAPSRVAHPSSMWCMEC